MPKRIIINAGGAFEYGGGCVHQHKQVLKLAKRPGLTEAIIASLFPDIFKDGDPEQLCNDFESKEGIISGKTNEAKNQLAKANNKLKKLKEESFEQLKPNIATKLATTKLTKDEAKKLSGYCLSQNINDIGVITVAAPNFNSDPDNSGNKYFNATKQKYDEWTSEEVEEYFRKMFKNICNEIIKQIKETKETETIVYFKAPGTGIFNPFSSISNKTEYDGYVTLVNNLMINVLNDNKEQFNDALGDGRKLTIEVDERNIVDRESVSEDKVVFQKSEGKVKDFINGDKKSAKVPAPEKLYLEEREVVMSITGGNSALKEKINLQPGEIITKDVVEILNDNAYEKNNNRVEIQKPEDAKIYKSSDEYKKHGKPYSIDPNDLEVTENTTSNAIAQKGETYHVIAHNFANENNPGGAPGYRFNITGDGECEVTGIQRCLAQEENLCEKSTLLESLNHKFYGVTGGIKSTSQALVSHNQLFAVDTTNSDGKIDWKKASCSSQLLDTPVPVTFITSAAKRYRNLQDSKKPDAITDAVRRIREQLSASAKAAHEHKQKDEKNCHIVMGAYGCGAFKNDPKAIASIYRKLLAPGGEFNEAFPEGTTFEFAIPKFGKQTDPNHNAFTEYLKKQHETYDHLIDDAVNKINKDRGVAPESKSDTPEKKLEEQERIEALTIKSPESDANIQDLSEWNNKSYKTLKRSKEEPDNSTYKKNLSTFLNPEKYVGWGGRLKQSNDTNSFTITEVIPGGFADAIGLKGGDKIQVNLDELEKDGVDLEAALIYRLREGKLDGITKMGDYDLSKESHKAILASYNSTEPNYQRVFTKKGNDYTLAEGQIEVKKGEEFQNDVLPKLFKDTDYLYNIIFSEDEYKETILHLLLEHKGLDAERQKQLVDLILTKTTQEPKSENTKPSSSPIPGGLIHNNGRGLRCGYYAIAAGILQLEDEQKNRIYEQIEFDSSKLKNNVVKDQYALGDAIYKYVDENKKTILKFDEFINSMSQQGGNPEEVNNQIEEILRELEQTSNIFAGRMALICKDLGINLKLNNNTYGAEQLQGCPTIEIFNPTGGHYEAKNMKGGLSREAGGDGKGR